MIPIAIGVLWMISKGLVRGLKDLEIRGGAETIQTKALLKSARILRRVLKTWGDWLSKGVMIICLHSWSIRYRTQSANNIKYKWFSNKFISPIDETTTPGLSGLGSNVNKKVLHTPHSSRNLLIRCSLMSYPVYSFGEGEDLTPWQVLYEAYSTPTPTSQNIHLDQMFVVFLISTFFGLRCKFQNIHWFIIFQYHSIIYILRRINKCLERVLNSSQPD